MPREIVRNDHVDGAFVVKVGWSNDSNVQLGVEGDEGRSLNWLLYSPNKKDLGERVDQLVTVGDWNGKSADEVHEEMGTAVLNILDTFGKYEGVWSQLDRAGCNRLIRILRKARDAAFGADA